MNSHGAAPLIVRERGQRAVCGLTGTFGCTENPRRLLPSRGIPHLRPSSPVGRRGDDFR